MSLGAYGKRFDGFLRRAPSLKSFLCASWDSADEKRVEQNSRTVERNLKLSAQLGVLTEQLRSDFEFSETRTAGPPKLFPKLAHRKS